MLVCQLLDTTPTTVGGGALGGIVVAGAGMFISQFVAQRIH